METGTPVVGLRGKHAETDAPIPPGSLEAELELGVLGIDDPIASYKTPSGSTLAKCSAGVRAFYSAQEDLVAGVLRDGCSADGDEDLP